MSSQPSDRMATRTVAVINKLGLHARAAARFVSEANRFDATIRVVNNRTAKTVDGRSIMALMMLAAGPGTELELQAEGEDAEQALTHLESLILERFGEPE